MKHNNNDSSYYEWAKNHIIAYRALSILLGILLLLSLIANIWLSKVRIFRIEESGLPPMVISALEADVDSGSVK